MAAPPAGGAGRPAGLRPLARLTPVAQGILLMLGAAIVLREGLGPRRIFGIMAALIGALIVIRPGSEVFTLTALLPLLGGLFTPAMR